jgi:hypothetical protein
MTELGMEYGTLTSENGKENNKIQGLTRSAIQRLALWVNCPALSLGFGMPRALHSESTWSASPSPARSDTIFPIPAAAIVDRHSTTPILSSIRSATVIMMKLSRKPNPIKGSMFW